MTEQSSGTNRAKGRGEYTKQGMMTGMGGGGGDRAEGR